MILHICSQASWQKALEDKGYEGDTLKSEGFIHCSTPEQVIEIADYMFKGKQGLILLVIDEKKVRPVIKYEDAGNGKLYPHIYGPLNLDAVMKTVDFPSKQNGTFEYPIK